MKTKKVVIVVLAICAITALATIAQITKPAIQEIPSSSSADALLKNPLSAPRIHHMQEAEKIDFGPDATHDIAISPEKDKIHVALSEKFLQQHGGAEWLSELKITERDNFFTPAQFQSFLERLHEALGHDGGDDHDHEHEDAHSK
jgi:hypothetical protein